MNLEKKKKKEIKWETRWNEVVSRLWSWARKMRGAEDCVAVQDWRRRGRNGVERVESLGPVTLIELGMAVKAWDGS